jgi:sigma54-dependent transcription regulator
VLQEKKSSGWARRADTGRCRDRGTQEDLGEFVKQQRFRSDLFYRLNVAVTGPPLRERREIPDPAPISAQMRSPPRPGGADRPATQLSELMA